MIKETLMKNGIKIVNSKIVKSDVEKAIRILNKTTAGASELKLESLGIEHDREKEYYKCDFDVILDLKKSFAKEVKENVSSNPDIQLEDLHETYENLDYVNDLFNALKLDNTIWRAIRNSTDDIDIQSVETELNFYAGGLPKVEEVDFDTDLKKMIENVGKLEATLTITLYYGVSLTDTMEKCRVIAEKALKGSDI